LCSLFIVQSTGWTCSAVCTGAWMPSPLQRECSIHCHHGKHCCGHNHKSGGGGRKIIIILTKTVHMMYHITITWLLQCQRPDSGWLSEAWSSKESMRSAETFLPWFSVISKGFTSNLSPVGSWLLQPDKTRES